MDNVEKMLLYGNVPIAKTFNEIAKFNPYHDRLGRFATGGGFMNSGWAGPSDRQARTFSANPETRAGAMAIARESSISHETIGRAYGLGSTKPAPGNKQPKPQKPKPQKPKAEKPKTEKPKAEKPSETKVNSKSVLTPKALDKCKAVEAKTVKRKTEKMTVIDDDGNVVFEKSGGKGSVSFSRGQAMAMEGKTITHNHPGEFGGTFSHADVNVFTKYGLKSIRAVAKEGTYSIEKTQKATPQSGKKFRDEYREIERKGTSALNSLYKKIKSKFMRGEISADSANEQLGDKRTQICNEHHEYIKRVAESYGYRYYYEPNGGVTKMYKTFYDLVKADEPEESSGDIVLDDDMFTGDNWKEKLGEFK